MEINSELLTGFVAREVSWHVPYHALDLCLGALVALHGRYSGEPHAFRARDKMPESIWTWVAKAQMPTASVCPAWASLDPAVGVLAMGDKRGTGDFLGDVFENELIAPVFHDAEQGSAGTAQQGRHRARVPVVTLPLELPKRDHIRGECGNADNVVEGKDSGLTLRAENLDLNITIPYDWETMVACPDVIAGIGFSPVGEAAHFVEDVVGRSRIKDRRVSELVDGCGENGFD